MDDNKLNIYLDQIGRSRLLSAEEEQKLSERVRNGDLRAQNRLVESNLRFVVSIASQYQGKGIAMDDLISEGNLGLIKAAKKYDASRGLRFASYAVIFIRQAIEKAIRQQTDERRLESNADGFSRSIDAPLGSKTNVSLLSVLVNDSSPLADERVHSNVMATAVEYALDVLNHRERSVVESFFGLDTEKLTMQEIAQDMGLNRERVRQIRDKAIRHMRKAYKKRLAELRQQG